MNKVVLHHIAQCSGSLVEAAALLDAQILHSRYLYVVDVVTVPKRLENTVGEAERQNILRGFLAQEVVDTVNLVLLEHRGIDTVQLARRVQIIAERLLHDDARMGTVQSRSLQVQRNHAVQRRRSGQVVQHAVRLLLARQLLKAGGQLAVIGGSGGIEREVVQTVAEVGHAVVRMLFRGYKTLHLRPYIGTVGIILIFGTSDT